MNLNLTTATRYGLNILALLGVSVAFSLGRSIFIPLIISALLAAILQPAARYLTERFRIPWFFSCLTTLMVLVVVHLLVFTLVAVSIPQMLSDLPGPNDEVAQKDLYEKLRSQITNASPFPIDSAVPRDPDKSGAFQYIRRTLTGDYITNGLLDVTKIGVELLWQGVLILFILLFLLLEGEMLGNKIRNIFGPGPDVQKAVTSAFREMGEAVRSYLVWRTIVNCGLAIVLGIVYHSLGLRQAILWALLTAILSYIPYLGTIAAGIPPVIDALLYVGPSTAFGILIFYTAIVTFEGYIIVPWVMGRSMDLNATTVILSCLYWDLVWGTAGLFLAMPLMAAIKAVCMNVEAWRPWGSLMSSVEHTPAASMFHEDSIVPLEEAEEAQVVKQNLPDNIDHDKTVIIDAKELKDRLKSGD